MKMLPRIVTGLLKGVALLPLPWLYLFSDFIYFVIYRCVGYRRKVVRANLVSAFPSRSETEIVAIEKEYYRFLGDVIVETVKLLQISPTEMKRRVEVVNPDVVAQTVAAGRSAVLLLGHYGNWEWVQEISRCFGPEVFRASIYRPLASPLWEEVYRKIRSRWHVDIIPQAAAVRTLLRPENRPWICGFIADARPRSVEADAVVEFLNHPTAFIYGPEVLGRKVGADYFFLEMERVSRGRYRIVFHPLRPDAAPAPYPHLREFWKEFEKVVGRKPAYWLWSHKRWK